LTERIVTSKKLRPENGPNDVLTVCQDPPASYGKSLESTIMDGEGKEKGKIK